MQCHGAVAPLQVMDGKQYTLVCLCYESNLQDTLSCSHYTLVCSVICSCLLQVLLLLKLRLLADVVLVGLPNVGKSSLIAALTHARAQVGRNTGMESSVTGCIVDQPVHHLTCGCNTTLAAGQQAISHVATCLQSVQALRVLHLLLGLSSTLIHA